MPDVEQLSFTEFVDLCLARLAEADRQEPGEFFDLTGLTAPLRGNVSDTWIVDAARVLDGRGLAEYLPSTGPVDVRLTGEGRLYLESGGETGIIDEYEREPSSFVVNVSGEGHRVAVSQSGEVSQTVSEQTGPVFLLIGQIGEALDADESLSEAERESFKTDLAAIRAQLQKQEPNRRAIEALLEPMSNVSSVGSFVTQLLSMVS